MAKEVFSRKRSIFCGPFEKELRKRLVKFFVWSVALYGAETWTLPQNEQKRLAAFEMWKWRRMERVKWTDNIKNAVVLEKVGEERTVLELIKKRKINWMGHWLRRTCLLKDALNQGYSAFSGRGPIYIFHIILRAAVIADYKIIMDILNIIIGAWAVRQVT